jgi:hypothetical protein
MHMSKVPNTLVRALLALVLAAPGLASAHEGWDRDDDDHGYEHCDHHGPGDPRGLATLSIRNDFDGEVQVFVDQRFVGVVSGDQTGTFQVNPGSRDVLVTRPGTNFVLAQSRMQVYAGTTALLPVCAPTSMVDVKNQGEVMLRVQLGASSVWISPGQSAQVPVKAGNASLTASIRDPRGEWKAIDRTFWVEPGQPSCQTLRPDPTVVVITNHDRFSVRALVDGHDEGLVGAGQSKRVWVRPGSTNVLLVDTQGRLRSNTTVVVGKGREGLVVLEPRYPSVGAVVTYDGYGRPILPIRPATLH